MSSSSSSANKWTLSTSLKPEDESRLVFGSLKESEICDLPHEPWLLLEPAVAVRGMAKSRRMLFLLRLREFIALLRLLLLLMVVCRELDWFEVVCITLFVGGTCGRTGFLQTAFEGHTKQRNAISSFFINAAR